MHDDNLLRVGKNVLNATSIPIDEGCWMRSGLDELELKDKAIDLLSSSDDSSSLKAAIQIVVLDNYISELIVEGIIDKSERETYLKKWASIQ